MAIKLDLTGREPIPHWQGAACLLVFAAMVAMIVADIMGFVPRPQTVPPQIIDRLEHEVQGIRSDQDSLRDEHERLRIEMRRSFAEIKAILEEK